jgi:hypothetical protein
VSDGRLKPNGDGAQSTLLAIDRSWLQRWWLIVGQTSRTQSRRFEPKTNVFDELTTTGPSNKPGTVAVCGGGGVDGVKVATEKRGTSVMFKRRGDGVKVAKRFEVGHRKCESHSEEETSERQEEQEELEEAQEEECGATVEQGRV